MKKSTVIVAAIVLIIVFVGGMSASNLVDGGSQKAKLNSGQKFSAGQMIDSSVSQLAQKSRRNAMTRVPKIVDDFEIVM